MKNRMDLKSAPMAVEIAHTTHIGFTRSCNQDALWMAEEPLDSNHKGRLLAVADGMGGHRGGGYASRFACNALNEYYERRLRILQPRGRAQDLARNLAELIFRIDRNLRFEALKDPKLEDMGTTLSCLVLTERLAVIAHVGDSRIYRLRRGHLTCLTRDHTFVEDMIFEKELTPCKAETHPLRHMLTQALGAGEPLEIVHTGHFRLKEGDRFLLCTDGLHNAVKPDRIATHLNRESTAGEIADGLLSEALAARARDNVTAVVVKLHPAVAAAAGRRTKG
jgi:protein phosphatase